MTSYLKIMGFLENKISCSGICQPAMTWYTKDITGPQPSFGCKKQSLAVIGGGYTIPGFILILSSIVILIVFFISARFWCEKKEPQWNN